MILALTFSRTPKITAGPCLFPQAGCLPYFVCLFCSRSSTRTRIPPRHTIMGSICRTRQQPQREKPPQAIDGRTEHTPHSCRWLWVNTQACPNRTFFLPASSVVTTSEFPFHKATQKEAFGHLSALTPIPVPRSSFHLCTLSSADHSVLPHTCAVRSLTGTYHLAKGLALDIQFQLTTCFLPDYFTSSFPAFFLHRVVLSTWCHTHLFIHKRSRLARGKRWEGKIQTCFGVSPHCLAHSTNTTGVLWSLTHGLLCVQVQTHIQGHRHYRKLSAKGETVKGAGYKGNF